jgi:hypothetical protein
MPNFTLRVTNDLLQSTLDNLRADSKLDWVFDEAGDAKSVKVKTRDGHITSHWMSPREAYFYMQGIIFGIQHETYTAKQRALTNGDK